MLIRAQFPGEMSSPSIEVLNIKVTKYCIFTADKYFSIRYLALISFLTVRRTFQKNTSNVVSCVFRSFSYPQL